MVDQPSELWARALAAIIDDSHLTPAEELTASADRAVAPLGLTVCIYVVDLAQRRLHPYPADSEPLAVGDTMAGRSYQFGEFVPATDHTGGDEASGDRLLWVPLLNGTERIGVLRVGLGDLADYEELRGWLWTLSGLVGQIVASKFSHSIGLKKVRADGLTSASELMWQLLPPRTFATERLVISALLEPTDKVAGDAYDYVHDGAVDVAVFDGLGHDITAGVSTTLAVTAIRNARRRGIPDLTKLAEHADEVLAAEKGPLRFVTAVLARLDSQTGQLSFLLAGHPPPLLLRGGRVVKQLSPPPRPPLGITIRTGADGLGEEQLEPGDRLLLYSDGVTEARDQGGTFFGEERLIDLAERAELDDLSAPETLRRLVAAVLAHQHGRLQDDATMLLLEWSRDGHLRLFPTEDTPVPPAG